MARSRKDSGKTTSSWEPPPRHRQQSPRTVQTTEPTGETTIMKHDILKMKSLALALIFLSGCQSVQEASRSAMKNPPTKEIQASMTPASALAELKAGNARFIAGHPLRRDMPADVKATASGQYPFAVVLSCLDSRQPIEI